MNPIHPPSEQLTNYVLGKLSAAEKEDVERHLNVCAPCRSRASALGEPTASYRGQTTQSRGAAKSTVDYVDTSPRKTVAGCVLLEDEAMAGGLGVVYKAYHPVLKDYRAIKRPQTREPAERAQLFARFRREVEAVGRLRHDHIVRAFDAGADDEGPYLVMEFLDGVSLGDLVRRHGPLPIAHACELTRQAALGLQAAYEQGLVHRDVKPSNLMLARVNSGLARVVIIDWGLVKQKTDTPAATPISDEATCAGITLGTPDYVAPEQILDARAVDTRADVYSLGATLYCLLAGKPPFHRRGRTEKMLAHQTEPFPPLRDVRSDVPAGLANVLRKMTDKQPTNRYATPAEVAAALKPFCCPESELGCLLDDMLPPVPPTSRRRVGWFLGLAAAIAFVLLVVSVSLSVMLFRNDRGKPGEPAGTGVLGVAPKLPERLLGSHPGHCSSIVFLPDGLHAVSESGGASVYVWDLKQRRTKKSWLHVLEQPDKSPNMGGVVAATPDGKYLLAGGLLPPLWDIPYFSLCDQKSFAVLRKDFTSFGKTGRALALAPDSSKLACVTLPGIIAFGQKPSVNIVEIPSGKHWQSIPASSPINSLAFSPDGQTILGGSEDGEVRLWQLKPLKLEREFRAPRASLDQVAFNSDGTRIFSASLAEETLRLWNNDLLDKDVAKQLHEGIEVRKTAGKMTSVAFSKEGLALTGHADGNVILWNLHQRTERYRFEHKQTAVTAVAISPDGQHALAALSDRSVFLHRLPSP